MLFNLSSTDGLDVLDEVDQAFSSPLWDQNGNMVHYEIPKATLEYNAEVRAVLARIGSPLQYYELINTQWPTEPTAAPAAFDTYPDNITNKSGGKPTPVYLIRSVMETYFQSGATGTTDTSVQLVVDGKPPVVIPRTNGGNTRLEYAERACISVGPSCGDAGQNLVLSTESCMGCHSSAPLYVSDRVLVHVQSPRQSRSTRGASNESHVRSSPVTS